MQRLFSTWLVLIAAALSAADETHQTVADRAFALLRQNPPVAPDVFDFAVVASTRSTRPDQDSGTFKKLIHDFNFLKPAFVVDAGDLITGGPADLLPAQWDAFDNLTGNLLVPLFPATGTHDVFDEASEKIWTDRVGPLTYAFTYGNSRFIILNARETNADGRMSDAQLAWLTNELDSYTAKNIFVFIHQAFFARDWERQWRMVHDVLKQHPVRMVFGGDPAVYSYFGERDGIQYVISGGGGDNVRVPEDEGGFPHFVLVSVRGETVDWSVVKPGSFLPKGIVMQDHVDEIKYARTAWMKTEAVEVPVGEAFKRSVAVSIDTPGEGEIVWKVPPGWHVTPESMKYAVAPPTTPPNGLDIDPPRPAATLEFDIRADDAAVTKYPVPEFTTTYSRAKFGGKFEVTGRLNLVPVYSIHRAGGAVTVDGDLSEWSGAITIPLQYASAFDIDDTADHQTTVQLMYDADNLYLAATVKDDEFHQPYAGDIAEAADNLHMFLKMEDSSSRPYVFKYSWEWGLSLTAAGPEVFMHHGVNRDGSAVNKTVNLAVKRAGELTYYEAAFPKTEVLPLSLLQGATFMLSIVSNDLDPSHAERPRHWSGLTPGVGGAQPGSPLAKIVLAE